MVSQKDDGKLKSKRRRGGPVIRPPKDYLKRLPSSSNPQAILPPTMLAPTASPFVYVAQTALMGNHVEDNEDDEYDHDGGRMMEDASTLFAEATSKSPLPPLFARGDFEYFSPKQDLSNYDYPVHGVPEVAFLGRSNVGKSSLVNALMRNNLCITSKSPGRTRLPYYYGLTPKKVVQERTKKKEQNNHQHQQKRINTNVRKDPSLVQGYLVDLPGYGFGQAPKAVVEDWQKDTQEWLLHRRHEAGVLQRLFLLLDARRGLEGPSELDLAVLSWLEQAAIPYTVVLTKADRVSVPLVVRQVNDFCLRYAAASASTTTTMNVGDNDDAEEVEENSGGDAFFGPIQSPVVHVTSSSRGWGINELMLSVEAEFLGTAEKDDDDEVDGGNSNGNYD